MADRRARKILILGSARTALASAPVGDASWEIWSIGFYDRGDAARLFEMHSDPVVLRNDDGRHLARLQASAAPVFMRHVWPEIPQSVAYPFEAVLDNLGRSVDWFAGSACLMRALAVHELRAGDTIGLFGVEALLGSEHGEQRPALWALKVLAEARGIIVLSPPESTLFRMAQVYGAPTPVGEGLTIEAMQAMRADYNRLYENARKEVHTYHGAVQVIDEMIARAKHAAGGGTVIW